MNEPEALDERLHNPGFAAFCGGAGERLQVSQVTGKTFATIFNTSFWEILAKVKTVLRTYRFEEIFNDCRKHSPSLDYGSAKMKEMSDIVSLANLSNLRKVKTLAIS